MRSGGKGRPSAMSLASFPTSTPMNTMNMAHDAKEANPSDLSDRWRHRGVTKTSNTAAMHTGRRQYHSVTYDDAADSAPGGADRDAYGDEEYEECAAGSSPVILAAP